MYTHIYISGVRYSADQQDPPPYIYIYIYIYIYVYIYIYIYIYIWICIHIYIYPACDDTAPTNKILLCLQTGFVHSDTNLNPILEATDAKSGTRPPHDQSPHNFSVWNFSKTVTPRAKIGKFGWGSLYPSLVRGSTTRRRSSSSLKGSWRLQCVAVCCSVLQFVALCCSVLQCVVVCCSVCTYAQEGYKYSGRFMTLF